MSCDHETPWLQVSNCQPPQDIVIETNTEAGQQQDLVLKDRLWWLSDMSMYVYYQPTMWRRKNG